MLQESEQAIEQPIKNDVNDQKWDAIRTAVDKLEFFKKDNADHDSIKNNVIDILQSYYKQGYTTMKEVYDANTEIILQNPNTDKCKGICLGSYEFIYGECQNRIPFHLSCGVKYDFEKNTYWEKNQEGTLVAVDDEDEERIDKIKAIANGTDNNENNIVLENTKDAGVGFCDKYFSWCCCCNSNAGLKALRDDGEYININHYQYKM